MNQLSLSFSEKLYLHSLLQYIFYCSIHSLTIDRGLLWSPLSLFYIHPSLLRSFPPRPHYLINREAALGAIVSLFFPLYFAFAFRVKSTKSIPSNFHSCTCIPTYTTTKHHQRTINVVPPLQSLQNRRLPSQKAQSQEERRRHRLPYHRQNRNNHRNVLPR